MKNIAWMIWAVAAITISGCGNDTLDLSNRGDLVAMPSPSAANSGEPHLAVAPDGTVVMSWLEPAGEESHAFRLATLQGETWSAATTIAEGNNWFVNWADYPSVVPMTQSEWAAHWLVKSADHSYAHDVALARSSDGGKTWSEPMAPHRDGTKTEHGFASLFPWNGGIGAIWLDARKSTRDASAMTLRFARLSYSGEILDEGEIDDLVCDCCMTDVALATDGPVVVYRDRTRDEIRDHLVRRWDGSKWAEPIKLGDDNWKIGGCPVNGPAIAASGNNVVAVWFTASRRNPRVQLARSTDGGRTFAEPVLVDSGKVSGRVDVVLLDDGVAIVSWIGKTEAGNGMIATRTMPPQAEPGPIRVIAETDISRAAGFPQMVHTADRLVFAWTQPGEPAQIQTYYLPLK